jgi:hypothetical protein
MEIIHYECYVHVNAIMWRVLYRELRAITNDSALHLNPLEINDVYEEVWNVGILLQSEEALSILDYDFRPWPKIVHGPKSKKERRNPLNFTRFMIVTSRYNPTLDLHPDLCPVCSFFY